MHIIVTKKYLTFKNFKAKCAIGYKGIRKKKVEENERDTVILQRRSVRAKRLIKKGEAISLDDFEFQRPCPSDALKLNDFDKYLGKKIKVDLPKDEYLKYEFF